jgi:hypothetical protein
VPWRPPWKGGVILSQNGDLLKASLDGEPLFDRCNPRNGEKPAMCFSATANFAARQPSSTDPAYKRRFIIERFGGAF